jgi:hypothetical protein
MSIFLIFFLPTLDLVPAYSQKSSLIGSPQLNHSVTKEIYDMVDSEEKSAIFKASIMFRQVISKFISMLISLRLAIPSIYPRPSERRPSQPETNDWENRQALSLRRSGTLSML